MDRRILAAGRVMPVFLAGLALTATGCGSPQFHAIGYGWPLQCNTIGDMYNARVSEGSANLATPEISSDAHAVLAVSDSALATAVAELLDIAEQEVERAVTMVEVPGAGNGGEIELNLAVRSMSIVDRYGTPSIDVRVGGRGHLDVNWPAGLDTRTDFRAGAVFRLGVDLESDDGTARIVFDPEASDIDHFEFTTGDEEGTVSDLIGWLETALVNAFDGPVLAAVGRRELVSIAPIQLGETQIMAEPLALVADEETETLRMMWGTSLDAGAIDAAFPELNGSEVSIFVPAPVLAPLARQVTNAIGGRRVNGDGLPDPNGQLWTFFEDMVVDGDELVLTYGVYNRKSPCSFTVLEVFVEPVVRDGEIHLELHDRRLLEGSRQQWLIRAVAPAIDQMENIMNQSITSGIAENQTTAMESGAKLRIEFDAVDVSAAGLTVRATIAASDAP